MQSQHITVSSKVYFSIPGEIRGHGRGGQEQRWQKNSRIGHLLCILVRIVGCKRSPRSSSPTICPIPPCLLNHIPKCHIYTFFKHLQGWGLDDLPGQPVPMPDRSFSKEIFPDIQSKPPLTQLEAIAYCPIELGEGTNTCSFQVVVESNKVPCQPPLEAFLLCCNSMRIVCVYVACSCSCFLSCENMVWSRRLGKGHLILECKI